jgi:predicted RNase H-like HicB family nuclease
MKIQIVIRQEKNKFYSSDIPGLIPTCHAFGTSLQEILEQIYKQLAGTTFKLNQSEPLPLKKEDILLEIYIEPGERYPVTELRRFEEYALQILEMLPGACAERTPDVIQINSGDFRDEKGVVVILTPEAIELRLPTLEWLGPHTPVQSSKRWKRINLENSKNINITKLIASAQEAQAQTFGVCKFCSQKKPTGWMFRQDVCDSCAEKHLGIIH